MPDEQGSSSFVYSSDAPHSPGLPAHQAVQRLVLETGVLRLAQAALGVAPILARVDVWFRTAPPPKYAAKARLVHRSCDRF